MVQGKSDYKALVSILCVYTADYRFYRKRKTANLYCRNSEVLGPRGIGHAARRMGLLLVHRRVGTCTKVHLREERVGVSSYPRNVCSAAPASLATPTANFPAAAITLTLNLSPPTSATSAHILTGLLFLQQKFPAFSHAQLLPHTYFQHLTRPLVYM